MAKPQPKPLPRDPDEWTTADAVTLRQYLAGNPKFLRALAKRRPKIEGNTMEARAVTGSDANGFWECLEVIEEFQRDPHVDNEDAGYLE